MADSVVGGAVTVITAEEKGEAPVQDVTPAPQPAPPPSPSYQFDDPISAMCFCGDHLLAIATGEKLYFVKVL